jgi:hypothetical protein
MREPFSKPQALRNGGNGPGVEESTQSKSEQQTTEKGMLYRNEQCRTRAFIGQGEQGAAGDGQHDGDPVMKDDMHVAEQQRIQNDQ